MADVMTIREAVQRAKDEGVPITEYTLRQWVKTGAVPVRRIGKKVLLYYPNLVKYLQCETGEITTPPVATVLPGLRRVEV